MQVNRFEAGEREEWLYARRGKITGSRVADVFSKNGRKIGFYELIAEKLGLPPDDEETSLERGARLEGDAIERFRQETGKEVDSSLILWMRDENENIAISPDGVISETEAVEAKCLNSANHIKAFLTKQIPADYELQALQYFIVNDKLETLHFVFYDPRFAMFSDRTKLDYFEIPITRAEVASKIENVLTYEREVIAEVNEIVNRLTF